MANNNDAARTHAALNRRRKFRQLLGFVVCFLVVVGAGSLIRSGVQVVANIFDDTDERLAFESRLQMLVALDPVPFDSLENANATTLLDAVLWQTIATIDHSTVERDEVGAMYLPSIDVDLTAASLYGQALKFTHATFENRGQMYTYVPEKEAYLIPITSATADYSPVVTKIKREGNTKRVTVGYISKYGEGGEFSMNTSDEPTKYNDFIFTKQDDGNYYLSAIVASETKVEAASSSSSTTSQDDALSLAPQEALQEATSDAMDDTSSSTASK